MQYLYKFFKKPLILAFFMALLLIYGDISAENSKKLEIFVSIPPQKYIVSKISGEKAVIHTLVKAGESPHTFSPTPKDMSALANADIFFRIGSNFEERLIQKIRKINKNLIIIDLRDGIKLKPIDREENHNHSDHTEYDPHIWLSPKLVTKISETVANTLIKANPNNQNSYKNNLELFKKELAVVDNIISKQLMPFKGDSFFVFHPAFGYFADCYNLKQVAIESEGKEPSIKELADLIQKAKELEVKMIFIEPQFSEKSAKTIADAIEGIIIKIDPLSEDYLKNLEDIALKISRSFNQE